MKNQKKCQLFAAVELIVIIVIVVGLLAVVMFFCAKNVDIGRNVCYLICTKGALHPFLTC